MAAEEIAHAGKIVEITPEFTTVEILSGSACGSCHAAGLCGLSEVKRKAVQVPTRGIGRKVGDEVNVCLRASMGLKAVAIAYLGPLVVLLAVVLSLQSAGLGDLLSGLAGIAAAALYFFTVWLFRDRIGKEYSFYIKE